MPKLACYNSDMHKVVNFMSIILPPVNILQNGGKSSLYSLFAFHTGLTYSKKPLQRNYSDFTVVSSANILVITVLTLKNARRNACTAPDPFTSTLKNF